MPPDPPTIMSLLWLLLTKILATPLLNTLAHQMKYVLIYSHFIPIFNNNSMKSWMMKPKFALFHDFLSVHHEYFVGTFASISTTQIRKAYCDDVIAISRSRVSTMHGLNIEKKNKTDTEQSRNRDSRYHRSAIEYMIELNLHLLVADRIERSFSDYFIIIWPAAGEIVTSITTLSHTVVDIQFPPVQICCYRYPSLVIYGNAFPFTAK